MNIYLAGPLFSIAQKRFNKKLKKHLLKIDPTLEINLPQDYVDDDMYKIYLNCINSILDADVIIAILDGSDADSGTAMEVGYARGNNKNIIGVRTDVRQLEQNGTNLMLYNACDKYIVSTVDVQVVAKKIYAAIQEDYAWKGDKPNLS
jgi:nucleoside 2-deoxyribosyltransferase